MYHVALLQVWKGSCSRPQRSDQVGRSKRSGRAPLATYRIGKAWGSSARAREVRSRNTPSVARATGKYAVRCTHSQRSCNPCRGAHTTPTIPVPPRVLLPSDTHAASSSGRCTVQWHEYLRGGYSGGGPERWAGPAVCRLPRWASSAPGPPAELLLGRPMHGGFGAPAWREIVRGQRAAHLHLACLFGAWAAGAPKLLLPAPRDNGGDRAGDTGTPG
jgi:hypothetical protein